MSRHTHKIATVELTGRIYVIYAECSCGSRAEFVEWHADPPNGWSKRQWRRARLPLFEALAKLRGGS